MKKSIKLIAILALLAIGFTSCHKDNNDELMGKIHKARYEVVSLGEEEAELSLIYITQKGVGGYNGLTTEQETNVTPWKHEFTIYESFAFQLFATSKCENMNEAMPIKAYLYIDDILVKEQTGSNTFDINLYYSYEE